MEDKIKNIEDRFAEIEELYKNITETEGTIQAKTSSIEHSLCMLKNEFENLVYELNKAHQVKLEEKEEEVEQGRSEYGNPYYYIETNGKVIYWNKEEYDFYDDEYYEFGNYFKSEEEAEKIAKKLKAITKVTRAINKANGDWKPDWEKPYKDKPQIAYDFDEKKMVGVCYWNCKQALSIPYIKDFTIAEKIIEEYEEELKIIFDIEE